MTDEAVCTNCGKPAEQGRYKLLLCAGCRDELSHLEFPKWIKVGFVVVVLVLLIAFFRFPTALQAGLNFEWGRRAESSGDYALAVSKYRKVSELFPDSSPVYARLGIAYFREGDLLASFEALKKVNAKQLSKEDLREVNLVVEKINQRLNVLRKAVE